MATAVKKAPVKQFKAALKRLAVPTTGVSSVPDLPLSALDCIEDRVTRAEMKQLLYQIKREAGQSDEQIRQTHQRRESQTVSLGGEVKQAVGVDSLSRVGQSAFETDMEDHFEREMQDGEDLTSDGPKDYSYLEEMTDAEQPLSGASVEDFDLESFGEMDQSFDDPHLKVASKAFSVLVKLCGEVVSKSNRDFASKSIHMSSADSQFVARAVDVDTTFEYRTPLLNQDNILSGDVVVPFDTLRSVMSLTPAQTVLLQRDGQTFINLVGGALPLETYTVGVENFRIDADWEEIGQVVAADLHAVLRHLSPLINSSPNTSEKRIIINAGRAYATYMYAIAAIEIDCPDLDLRIRDASNLRIFLSGQEGLVKLYRSVPDHQDGLRYVAVEGSNFRYTFLDSSATVPASLRRLLGEEIRSDGVFVDVEYLAKYVGLAAELQHGSGRIGFNLTPEHALQVLVKIRKAADSVFALPGQVQGSPQRLSEAVVLPAAILKLLLAAYRGRTSLLISLSDRGIGIQAGEISAALFVKME